MDIEDKHNKRPKGLLLIIVILMVSLPFNIYDLIFNESEFFIVELITVLYFGLTTIGLWYKNELARRSLIVISGILIVIHILLLTLMSIPEISSQLTFFEFSIMVLSFLFTIFSFFYLRSHALLRYYWS